MDISKETIRSARRIYEKLVDETSKEIFLDKLLYSMTGDFKYISKIITKYFLDIDEKMKEIKRDKELIIYGAGANCEVVLLLCNEYAKKVSYICDRDIEKQKNGYQGYQVISPEELVEKHRDAYVWVSTTTYADEVSEYLRNYFAEEKLLFLDYAQLTKQYFEENIIKLNDGEVFVDGGCFDFETSNMVMERCNPTKIYAFEPDKYNYEKIEKVIESQQLSNVVLLNKGLWNKEEVLRFSAQGSIMSRVSEDGEEKIEVVALDEVIEDKVTFIKMDIEGSELNALRGAEKIIKRDKPKLAICIYHKPEDTIDIPSYILSLVPEYKLYIRHYSYSAAETVLYAI